MELDELKSAWQATNQRVVALEYQIAVGRVKPTMTKAIIEPVIELLFGGLTAIVAGSFVADNIGKIASNPVGGGPALLIGALGVFTIGLSAWQIAMVQSIDFSRPVAEMQRTLMNVWVKRVKSTWATLLLGMGAWFVFPIFALQLLGGFEVYRNLNGAWALGNLVFGLVATLIIWWCTRRFPNSKLFRGVDKVFGGMGLGRALEELKDVKEFEAESA